MAAKFTAGQLVKITDPRSLAYGRIAMVMGGGQPTQSKLRFADLPRMVEPTDDPHTGLLAVETFNNNQLEAVEGILMSPFYALVTIDERNGEQEYRQQVLARGNYPDFEAIAQEIARTWYDGDGATWDAGLEAYWTDFGASVSVESWKLITLSRYVALRDILSDATPT